MTNLKKPIAVKNEQVNLLRFSIDLETNKIQIEGISRKYNEADVLVNSEPIYLNFRQNDIAKNYILEDVIGNSFNLLLRKLEIDRNLEYKDLCKILPDNIFTIEG